MTAIPTEEFAIDAGPDSSTALPEPFWNARPQLSHVRQAAWSRLVAPDALLGALLCRVAALTPHTVEIPPIVATASSLTFYASLVGPPETGKSGAAHVAAELLPAPDGFLDLQAIGSGEGLVEAMFDFVDDTDDKGKAIKVKRQVRHGLICHVDEVKALTDLGNRSGSTLLSTLRSAWTGAPLGNLNASVERRRLLAGGSYVYGLTAGMQPELAGPLLADANAGTPQRFLWLSATDANTPDGGTDWPGELAWEPPDLDRFEQGAARAGWVRHPLRVHRTIAEEVRAHRVATVRGEVRADVMDSHRNLLRLKVAGLLAILDRRANVNDDDWHLAGIAIVTSRSVRRSVETALLKVEAGKETASAARSARREISVEQTKAEQAMVTASRAVARVVERHDERGQHKEQGGGCVRSCLNQAISGKHRELVTLDDVIDRAEDNGWISNTEGRWHPGESRPA